MNILQKIEWKARKWNLKFNLLSIDLHDGDGCWGITIGEVIKDYRPYSLFSFEFRLPNGAERTQLQITNWDLFYISTPIYDWVSKIEEDILWGYEPSMAKGFLYRIANKLYKNK